MSVASFCVKYFMLIVLVHNKKGVLRNFTRNCDLKSIQPSMRVEMKTKHVTNGAVSLNFKRPADLITENDLNKDDTHFLW